MLGFERRVVAILTTTTDPAVRDGVAAWVDETLRDMPEHIRLGVALESLGLGLWAALRRPDDDALVAALDRSPLWAVRQYVRLLRGLVLFAEQELDGAAA